MVIHVVRGLWLVLVAALMVVGLESAAQAARPPAVVTKAANKLTCTDRSAYDADKPVKYALECYIQGKDLGVAGDGRTDMLLFKTVAAGKAFWDERLEGCGSCYIVRKGKLWIAGGGGYEKDIAKHVKKKLGGKIFAY